MSYFEKLYRNGELPNRAKLVYLYLHDRCDAEQKAWPGMGATFGGAVFSAAWLVGLAALCAVAGYWKIRRRSI